MTDVVFVRGLRVAARVGVTEEERREPQTLIVDVEAEVDLAEAGATDDLHMTLDYGDVAGSVARSVGASEAKLLETVAERVATLVLRYRGVTAVAVEITKESPPIPEQVAGTGVRVRRVAK